MRYLFLISALLTTTMTLPAEAVKLDCNPAVQNWQNGSRTTCPYSPSGYPADVATIVAAPSPVVEDEPEDISVEIPTDFPIDIPTDFSIDDVLR